MTGERPLGQASASARVGGWPGQAGFTLLELLVAMTIMALVSVLALFGLRIIAGGTAERQRDIVSWASDARVLEIAVEELSRALPLDWGPPGSFRVAFDGDDDSLRFVNATPGYRSGTGLVMWQYRLDAVGGRTVVYLQRRPLTPESAGFGDFDDRKDQPVAQFPGELSFAYFGKADEEESGQWQSRWRDAPRLPAAVRLGDDSSGPPLLTVSLHIDLPAECLAGDGGSGEAC
jgi:prepilin-type N-terminal cleavage/methylation domain-containing protein